MRGIAKFLTLVTLLVLLLCGYVVWASDLSVLSCGAVVQSAADRSDAFENIRQMTSGGSDDLIMFKEQIDSGAEQYSFVTYTLRLRNLNLLAAEWLQIDLTPSGGDILMLKPSTEDVPAFNEQLLTFVLMTDRSTADYRRDAVLTYYIYGHAFSIPVELTA